MTQLNDSAEPEILGAILDPYRFEKLRKYLDDDCHSHLHAGHGWSLDAGKLRTALEESGALEEHVIEVVKEGDDIVVYELPDNWAYSYEEAEPE